MFGIIIILKDIDDYKDLEHKNKLKFTLDHVKGIIVQRINVTNTSHQQNEST